MTTINDINIGDFFVSLDPVIRRGTLMQLVARHGARKGQNNPVVRAFTPVRVFKDTIPGFIIIMKVTLCKVCRDCAINGSVVDPCECHTL